MNQTTIAAAIQTTNERHGIPGCKPTDIETIVRKGRDGWRAESKIDLGITVKLPGEKEGLPARLDIDTSKHGGGIGTYAYVVQTKNGMVTFAIGGSFHERIRQCPGRCTEKSVKAQHEDVLLAVSEVITRAKAFYAAKAQTEDLHTRRARELAERDAARDDPRPSGTNDMHADSGHLGIVA